jgi:hypothetical protein
LRSTAKGGTVVCAGTTSTYKPLLGEIKEWIHSAQYEALRAVNKELITLDWDNGHMIVDRQKDERWAKSVVQRLASDRDDVECLFFGRKHRSLFPGEKDYMLFRPFRSAFRPLGNFVGNLCEEIGLQ